MNANRPLSKSEIDQHIDTVGVILRLWYRQRSSTMPGHEEIRHNEFNLAKRLVKELVAYVPADTCLSLTIGSEPVEATHISRERVGEAIVDIAAELLEPGSTLDITYVEEDSDRIHNSVMLLGGFYLLPLETVARTLFESGQLSVAERHAVMPEAS